MDSKSTKGGVFLNLGDNGELEKAEDCMHYLVLHVQEGRCGCGSPSPTLQFGNEIMVRCVQMILHSMGDAKNGEKVDVQLEERKKKKKEDE